MIGNISDVLLKPLKDVSRLVKKFKMRDKSHPFVQLYTKDTELIELQQKLNDGSIMKFLIYFSHFIFSLIFPSMLFFHFLYVLLI